MARRTIHLDGGPLGNAAAVQHPVGAGALGKSRRTLRFGRRLLARRQRESGPDAVIGTPGRLCAGAGTPATHRRHDGAAAPAARSDLWPAVAVSRLDRWLLGVAW